MKNETIKAQNWTGENVTFSHDENSIEIYGIKFVIEQLPRVSEIPEFKHWKVTDEAGISFGITQWNDEPFMGISGDIVREGYDLKKVAVAVITNLY